MRFLTLLVIALILHPGSMQCLGETASSPPGNSKRIAAKRTALHPDCPTPASLQTSHRKASLAHKARKQGSGPPSPTLAGSKKRLLTLDLPLAIIGRMIDNAQKAERRLNKEKQSKINRAKLNLIGK